MKRVSIVTDSSACLRPGEAQRLGVRVLPIMIQLSSGEIHDGTEGAADRVYRALARDEPVKSSAPSPLDYLAAMEAGESEAVLVITPAAEFTVMYRNAVLAAELARRPVIVIDCRTAAAAHGLIVLEACAAAEAGGSAQEVADTVRDATRRAHLVAALPGLEFVQRSGRVPAAALGLASLLGVRPVFGLEAGTVRQLGVPRSRESAIRRTRREALARGLREATRSAVFHAADPEGAEELRRWLGGHHGVIESSPSMGIHTGPGVVGVAWLGRADASAH